jgi:hypothetical protein
VQGLCILTSKKFIKWRELASVLQKGQGNHLPIVKLPAHRAGLPGNEISFLIVPLDPPYKAGLAGHLPAKDYRSPVSHI